jgi:hypothetical protein
MGQLQGMGPSVVRLSLITDRTGRGTSGLWAGVDTTLSGAPLAQSVRAQGRQRVDELLARYTARVDSARLLFATPLRSRLRDLLSRADDDLQQARRQVVDGLAGGITARAQLDRVFAGDPFEGELRRFGAARLASQELISDAVSEDARVVPGQSVAVTISVWNPSASAAPVSLCLDGVELGWRTLTESTRRGALPGSSWRGTCLGYQSTSGALAALDATPDSVPPQRLVTARLEATVPESEDYSTPYFLRLPRQGDLYQWDLDDRAVWGLPFEPARFRLTTAIVSPGRSPFAATTRAPASSANRSSWCHGWMFTLSLISKCGRSRVERRGLSW